MLDHICKIIGIVTQNITYLGTMLYLAELQPKKLLSIRFIISFAVFNPLMYMIQLNDNNWVLTALFLTLFLYTIIIQINTEYNFSKSLIITIFGYMFVSLIQIVSLLLINLLHLKLDIINAESPVTLLYLLVSLAFTFLACYFFNIKKFFSRIMELSYSVVIMVIMTLLLFTVLIQIYDVFETGLAIPTISTFIVFFIVGVLISLEAAKDYKRKQALMSYNTYLPIVHQMILNIQKRQHLYNNQIQSLVCLARNKDTDALIDAVINLSNTSISDDNSYNFLHLENQLLAGLLFCKYQTSLEQQKNMNFEISSYKYISNCNDFEIVDIAGILLDNALEATNENDTIYVSIGQASHKPHTTSNSNSPDFTIKVENPGPIITNELTHSIFSTHYTTKAQPDGHGLGLFILKSTVEKYNGTITLSNTYPEGPDTPYFCIEISV